MTPRFVASGILFAIVLAGTALGLAARSRRKMNLEEWAVAGRGLGLVLLWLLTAGEIYTTFSFLGASGWAYSRGGPSLYILAYITLGYAVSFFILPYLWEAGRRFSLQTQSDFFERRYGSKYLGVAVSIVGFVFVIPYLEIQLIGLGIIVQAASFDAIGRSAAIGAGLLLVTAFVAVGGVRSVAWVSVLKDSAVVIAALSIGLWVPHVYFGGIGPMFKTIALQKPSHLTMPGATQNMGHLWFVSTVILTSLGFYMWPHTFGATFTAKSAEILRRNAVVMPLYTVSLAFILFTGFAAVLVLPGLKDGDMSLILLVRRTFPAWFLGLTGGAGALTAMVPAAIIILAASTLFVKNVVRPLLAPDMTETRMAALAKITVVLLSLISFYLALHGSTTLVALLLLGYAGITQFFPGVVLGLFWNGATKEGVAAGLAGGLVTLTILILSKHDPFFGLNTGFVGLCVNFFLAVVVSVTTRGRVEES